MPRGKPFSGKQKKAQLQLKRAGKREAAAGHSDGIEKASAAPATGGPPVGAALTESLGKSKSGVHRNKWSTVVAREDKAEVEQRRIAAGEPLDLSARGQPIVARAPPDAEDAVLAHPRGVVLRAAAAVRPSAGVERNLRRYVEEAHEVEDRAFQSWLATVYAHYPRSQLNYFEHNLEVWMQLWHTVATADVICIIADVRNPLYSIPPSLYDQVTRELQKPLVVVLNKCDLVSQRHTDAWLEYLRARYTSNTRFVPFSSSGAGPLLGLGEKAGYSLSARRRAIRESRRIFDAEHVTNRAAVVRALLEAASVPSDLVDVVVSHVMGTLQTKRPTTERQARAGAHGSGASSLHDLGPRGGDDEGAVSYFASSNDEDENEDGDGDGGSSGNRARRAGVAEGRAGESVSEPDDEGGYHVYSVEEEGDDNDGPATSVADDDDEVDENDDDAADIEGSAQDHDDEGGVDRAALGSRVLPPKPHARHDHSTGNSVEEAASDTDDDAPAVMSDKAARRALRKAKKSSRRAAAANATADPEGDETAAETAASATATTSLTRRPPRDQRAAAAAAASAVAVASEQEAVTAMADPPSLILTIGMVGHPNVGKSSVINTLCAEKRVSVSRTAGHTKRAQTIPLAPGLHLLDCPGLLFPHALVGSRPSIAPAPTAGTVSVGRGVPTSVTPSASSICAAGITAREPSASISAVDASAQQQPQQQQELATRASAFSGPSSSSADVGLVAPTIVVLPSSIHALPSSASAANAISSVAVSSYVRGASGSHRHGAPASTAAAVPPGSRSLLPPRFKMLPEEEERAMQELCGVVPLAQVREPYTAVRYVSEHLPIENMYGLSLPKDETEWTPLLLCETLAAKRGLFIARVGRPDAHSAGRSILYDVQDGVVPLAWLPPTVG